MNGALATRLRCGLCVVSVIALVTGCGGGGKPDARPSTSATPGAVTTVPTSAGDSPSPSDSRPPDDLPIPERIDEQDATALAKGALTVMYTVDSTVDAGLRDAKLRAERFLTPDYAAKIKAEPRQYVPGEWQEHRAYLAVHLKAIRRDMGAPSDEPTVAYRQWELTTTPTGRDAWRGEHKKSVIYMALTRSSNGAPWRVSEVLINDSN